MMKIQYLAVVFIIIMLPISLVFSAYTSSQTETLDLQIKYDIRLDNSTFDAIKAFQMNTVNSSTSDIVNSKIRDIEAAANSFYTSIGTAFNMSGYNADTLKEYIPALVFTMYDGFYIYSPFVNTLDQDTIDSLKSESTYVNGEKITGLKPYIFYSCRYKKGSSIDVVITYSLDNYITIQGTVNGKPVNDAGYLLDNVSYNESTGIVKYRGIQIEPEERLQEYVGGKLYYYIKINGVKYYQENDRNWFSILNGKKNYEQGPFNTGKNDMAYRYYKEAAEFKKRLQSYGIADLTSSNAVDENGNPLTEIKDADGNVVYDFINSNYKIFDDFKNIEEPDSNFNDHRLAVIRYVIEKNLSIALANYNQYAPGKTYNFRMPQLTEEDWGKLLNNVSLISFLQGLSIGGKIYNGYSIINNNKNEEVVTEDSIYIIENANDPTSSYHRVTSTDINVNTNSLGAFNMDFERKSIIEDASTGKTSYYYPRKQLGCYSCYVIQSNVASTSNIYKYLDSLGTGSLLAKKYYTALGRERYSMYKVFRNPEEHLEQFKIT